MPHEQQQKRKLRRLKSEGTSLQSFQMQALTTPSSQDLKATYSQAPTASQFSPSY
jgi:hypothetical protein